MTPAALALSCALAASLDGVEPANDNGQPRERLSESSSTDGTSSAPASLSTTSSVAEASPFSSRHMCDRPMPARSATCVNATPFSSATTLSRRASTLRSEDRLTFARVTVAVSLRFPYQGIMGVSGGRAETSVNTPIPPWMEKDR